MREKVYSHEKYLEIIARGKCVLCGENVSRTNKMFCEEHRKIRADAQNARAKYFIAHGRCRTCGKPMNNRKGTVCDVCRERVRLSRMARDKALMDKGLCVRCKKPNDSGARTCYACSAYLKYLALERKKRKEKEAQAELNAGKDAEKAPASAVFRAGETADGIDGQGDAARAEGTEVLTPRAENADSRAKGKLPTDLEGLSEYAKKTYKDYELGRRENGEYYIKWHSGLLRS